MKHSTNVVVYMLFNIVWLVDILVSLRATSHPELELMSLAFVFMFLIICREVPLKD